MKNFLLLLIPLLLISSITKAYDDSFIAIKADAYTIDGQANEAFWANAQWYDIEYVWLPYGATMATGDFSGRVKLAWTNDVLLLFAEIEDNELSDDHSDKFSNYWDDDCFEIFLDEDHSGGGHETGSIAYNAFSYHCAINEEDVIDIGSSGYIALNDHVEFDLDTLDNNIYHWELAIKIYDDTYDEDGTNTPVTLTANKEMGLSIAYCDNDETNARENFIGLVNVSSADQNAAYQNADVFGKLTLVDDSQSSSFADAQTSNVSIYPSKVNSNLYVDLNDIMDESVQFRILDLNGRLVIEKTFDTGSGIQSFDMTTLSSGAYLINISGNQLNHIQLVYKQ